MIHQGDALSVLRSLPDESAQMCCTSPPYWGLRDYGVPGQLGLEKTPAEYVAGMVAVFREVRRVLKPDGVIWLNLGDSYCNSDKWGGGGANTGKHTREPDGTPASWKAVRRRWADVDGLKPKDLVGIPWMVAEALKAPYYAGRIKDERDRIWLAAMLDAEGCLFIHKRKAGQANGQGYFRTNDNYGPGVEIANTSRAVVDRIMALVGQGSICSQGPDETGGRRKQTIYRWNLRTTECRDFVRELYPHLVAKQQQARILIGCPSSGERAEAAHSALKGLHRTGASAVDFPAPPSLFEPGLYLRCDVVWSKANPMPESVTDRPTRAHEYIFLLSKSERYYYDAKAIKEPGVYSTEERKARSKSVRDDKINFMNPPKPDKQRGHGRRHSGFNDRWDGMSREEQTSVMRNKRSVWSIATHPFPEAHFATFPEEIPTLCILAGSRPGDVVLDPFNGAGTTGVVCEKLGRAYVGIELNPAYVEMANRRIGNVAPLFREETA